MASASSFSFREFEHSGWQQSVSAYDKFFGPLTASTTNALLAGVSSGTRLLDVATGPGYVAAEAWRRDATAIGVDFSDEMVARAKALFLDHEQEETGLSYEVGDAENLCFGPSEFDAVVMNFGVLHLSNPEKAFEEAFRVLRPGGRYAFTVWAPPEEAQGFALMLKCIQTHGDPNVTLPAGPPFFRFSDPAESERCLSAVGFTNISSQKLPLKWSLGSAEELFEAFYAGTARTGGLLRAQAPKALAKVREAVSEASRQYEREGKLEIPMPALLVTAHK
jgi:ubiquinone/menaquinone biosynthesis C-methylase UbiE